MTNVDHELPIPRFDDVIVGPDVTTIYCHRSEAVVDLRANSQSFNLIKIILRLIRLLTMTFDYYIWSWVIPPTWEIQN